MSGDGKRDRRAPSMESSLILHAPGMAFRRLAFFGLVSATAVLGCVLLYTMMDGVWERPLAWVLGSLFLVLFGWIALAFWTAVAGFVLRLLRREALSLGRPQPQACFSRSLGTRTALVMPIHNENPLRVVNGLAAIGASLAKTREEAAFEIFLLSDTTDPAIAVAERDAVARLRSTLPSGLAVHYRRRSRNTGRKAGNVADFCQRWGARYDHMVVLDADSLMTGDALVTLVRYMEANPETGLIQTVPVPVRQRTLFGRLLQYAGAAYSPMLASGLAFWYGDAANYWGHNAIVRVQPFTAHCGLPTLPGRPPLGGEILSHDFVEAALLRRAGWSVWLLPELEGSYEELPVNMLAYARRDRRWTQGNLQHLRLLAGDGLHPMSRLHFLMGALTYLVSPLWLALLLLTTLDVLRDEESALLTAALSGSQGWFGGGVSSASLLLGLTVLLLLAPRLLGSMLLLRHHRPAFGGAPRITLNALVEMMFSVLLAPVLLAFHASFVLQVLLGQATAWDAQQREGRMLPWWAACRGTIALVVPAAIAVGVLGALAPTLLWWLLPVVLPVLSAPLLARATSRPVAEGATAFMAPPTEREPVDVLEKLAEREQTAALTGAPGDASLQLPQQRPRPMPAQPLRTLSLSLGRGLRE